ncbi:DUF2333 family protein [Dyella sp. BiH032]|uniref:DUF2333 family protein n=1 Tax=Dyella sp. BiH032 TaxID=3075430 RepID=UPI0028934C70|nr:DUF2333 family protein [Dyella sp. BiH032]WNL45861.1 DUF2333 family protein [Dyella sp. BiH032]
MQAKDPTAVPSHAVLRVALVALALPLLAACIVLWWWDREPTIVNPAVPPRTEQVAMRRPVTPGAATTISVIRALQGLAGSREGHNLHGHHHPTGPAMEGTPGWERGSLTASRDLLHALRTDFTRPHAPLVEDKDLAAADVLLSGHPGGLSLHSAESQYRKATDHLLDYLDRLTDDDPDNAHFYVDPASLADYLQLVSDRLDTLQDHLAAGMVPPHQREVAPPRWPIVTSAIAMRRGGLPWRHADETLYEARGYTATLLAQMKAFQHDFGPVLKSDQAKGDLSEAIHELEALQAGSAAPLALDGAPMLRLPAQALALADAVSRIDDAVIDLCEELRKG